MISSKLPAIIQGGMGVGVSNWRLARAVSRLGHMGVVSGTALSLLLVRRLQSGDPGGHMVRALRQFPLPGVAERIISKYYIAKGKDPDRPFVGISMLSLQMNSDQVELLVAASFVEVHLAKEGHGGIVGVNLLEKIQLPTLATLYGAMMAGVDYVLMGAGIPNHIPGILDAFSRGEDASLKIDVTGVEKGTDYKIHFSPAEFMGNQVVKLPRPRFLAVISSATLAITLARKANGRVDGFVVEGSSAGGHNAPPRGLMQLNPRGEPVYSVRDAADLEKIKAVGLPFWLAGSYGNPGKLREARTLGAVGIQVGTAFAFCDESGIDPDIKLRVLAEVADGALDVFTDPAASPTGFPFKLVRLDDISAPERRRRACDLGVLRQAYLRNDQTVGYRCPSEPLDDFQRKGGDPADSEGRKCICNGLMATIGLGQRLGQGRVEPPLITAGDCLTTLAPVLLRESLHYTAADVIRMLTQEISSPVGKTVSADF